MLWSPTSTSGSRRRARPRFGRFFRINRHVLRADGVIYPDIAAEEVGNATPAAFALLGHTPRYFRAEHPEYEAELDLGAYWRELTDQAEPGKALLLSSEELSGVAPERLRNATAFDGREKRILVYLRRQDAAIEAGYQQEVRAGIFSGAIDEYVADVLDGDPARGRFDYVRLVSDCWEAFGRDHVTIVPYREKPPRKWIFNTALRALGLRRHDGYWVPPRGNPSLHPLMVEYLRRRLLHGSWSSTLARTVMELAREAELTAGLPRGLLSAEQRERVLTHFAAGNAALAAELPGAAPRDLFARDSDPPTQFRPHEHADAFDRLDRALVAAAS